MEQQVYRLNKVAFHNSANCNFVSFDFTKDTHITGRNNIGKTAKLNGLQIGYLPHMSFKGAAKKFNFDKDYGEDTSYDFYFPDSNSYIVYEYENPHGTFCQIVYKSAGDLALERCFLHIEYEQILKWLWTFEEGDEVGTPTRISRKELLANIQNVKHSKIVKTTKEAKEIMYNGSLTSFDQGKFSIASVNENRIDNILDILKISSNVGSIDNDMLRKIVISLLSTSYQDNKNDAVKYDPVALMEQFGRIKSEREILTRKKNYLGAYHGIKANFSSLNEATSTQNFEYSLLTQSINKAIELSSEKLTQQQAVISDKSAIYTSMEAEGRTMKSQVAYIRGQMDSNKKLQFKNLSAKEEYDQVMNSEDSGWLAFRDDPQRVLEIIEDEIKDIKEQITEARNIDRTIKSLLKLNSELKSLEFKKENIRSQIENIENLLIGRDEIKPVSGILVAINPAFSSVQDDLTDEEVNTLIEVCRLFENNNGTLTLQGIPFGTVSPSTKSTAELVSEEEEIEIEIGAIKTEIERKSKSVENQNPNYLSDLEKQLKESENDKRVINKFLSIQDSFEQTEKEIEELELSYNEKSAQYQAHRTKYIELGNEIKLLKSDAAELKRINDSNIAVRRQLDTCKQVHHFTHHETNIAEEKLLDKVSQQHLDNLEARFRQIVTYKKSIIVQLNEFVSINIINDPNALLVTGTIDYSEIEKALVSQLDTVFESIDADEERLNDSFQKQADIILQLSADLKHHLDRYKSYIKKLNRQLGSISLSSIDSIVLDAEFHPRVERFIEVIEQFGLSSDDALHAMDNGLEEQIRSFIYDMGLQKSKNMTVNIETMIKKVSLKYVNENKFVTSKGSNGTSIITSVILLTMFTREICGEDIALIMPISIDEIASVDRSNIETVYNFIKSNGFFLFSASPSIPHSAIELFDVIIPLEDYENTSDSKLLSKAKMTYHYQMGGIVDQDDDVQVILPAREKATEDTEVQGIEDVN